MSSPRAPRLWMKLSIDRIESAILAAFAGHPGLELSLERGGR